jgi:hypothetical protein
MVRGSGRCSRGTSAHVISPLRDEQVPEIHHEHVGPSPAPTNVGCHTRFRALSSIRQPEATEGDGNGSRRSGSEGQVGI